MSASTLRFNSMPAFFKPLMNLLYEISEGRQAALMRTIHSERKSRFFRRRPDVAVAQRFLDRFLRGAIQLALGEEKAFRAAQRLVAVIPPLGPRFTLGTFSPFIWMSGSNRLWSRGGRHVRRRCSCSVYVEFRETLVRNHAAQASLVGLVGQTTACPSLRLRERDLEVKICRANAWRRFTLPVPVFLNRLDAPLWVFNFGIICPGVFVFGGAE